MRLTLQQVIRPVRCPDYWESLDESSAYPLPADNVDGWNPYVRKDYDGTCYEERGIAHTFAMYMYEMSIKRPIAYWLWYRWWIPAICSKDTRKHIYYLMRYSRYAEYRSYWLEFSLYHPYLFILYIVFSTLFELCEKSVSTTIKFISRFFKRSSVVTDVSEHIDKDGVNQALTQEDSNVP